MIIFGIDPGQTGAISLFQGTNARVMDLPVIEKRLDAVMLASLLVADGRMAFIEKSHAMPGQGVTSTFNYGVIFGAILATLQIAKVPYTTISAAAWKKAMKVPGGKENKDAARLRALELWPWLGDDLRRKKDHNRAEALLIGEYGRRSGAL